MSLNELLHYLRLGGVTLAILLIASVVALGVAIERLIALWGVSERSRTLGEAVNKLPERVPVPEASFFAIVVGIQQRAGGNLSETLGNLSRVLRERRKMVGKITAMSMEAKASAAIIGALPIIVMGLVYLTSPKYISLLFTDPMGNLILGASAIWMMTGIFVMKRMINFDF